MALIRNKTFFGFYPANDSYSEVEVSYDLKGRMNEESRTSLSENLYHHIENKWEVIISKDYLCQFYLEEYHIQLDNERNHNATSEVVNMTLGATRKVQFKYIDVLNSFYFLLYASCFTGRNTDFLNDFIEVSLWDCLAMEFSQDNQCVSLGSFGRDKKKRLYRLDKIKSEDFDDIFYQMNIKLKDELIFYLRGGKLTSKKSNRSRNLIELNIFKDAIHYWKVIYDSDLISLASLASKILSEHRLENYDVSIALVWFELEKWINYYAGILGVPIYQMDSSGNIQYFPDGTPRFLSIAKIINTFPVGSIINSLKPELDVVRGIRNDIAHGGVNATHPQSVNSIELFIKMFNIRSGLNLGVRLAKTGTTGM